MKTFSKLIIELTILLCISSIYSINQQATYKLYYPGILTQKQDYHSINYIFNRANISTPSENSLNFGGYWKVAVIRPSDVKVFYKGLDMYDIYTKFLPNKDGSSSKPYVAWTVDGNTSPISASCVSGVFTVEIRVKYFDCIDDANTYYGNLSSNYPKVLFEANGAISSQQNGYKQDSGLVKATDVNNFGDILLGTETGVLDGVCPSS